MTDQQRLDRMDELRAAIAWLMCGREEDGSKSPKPQPKTDGND